MDSKILCKQGRIRRSCRKHRHPPKGACTQLTRDARYYIYLACIAQRHGILCIYIYLKDGVLTSSCVKVLVRSAGAFLWSFALWRQTSAAACSRGRATDIWATDPWRFCTATFNTVAHTLPPSNSTLRLQQRSTTREFPARFCFTEAGTCSTAHGGWKPVKTKVGSICPEGAEPQQKSFDDGTVQWALKGCLTNENRFSLINLLFARRGK